jgi:hypothetical protein
MHQVALAVLLSSCLTGQIPTRPSHYSQPGWGHYDRFGSYGNYSAGNYYSGPTPFYPLPVPKPLATTPIPKKLFGPGGGMRQDLANLDPNSPTMQSFRRAIEAMRRLPPDDPHSLVFQANIHGFPGTSSSDLWGQCQHGNWWFLPWHRAYLHYLERIMRRYAEDPSFCLPYWDYSNPQARSLPTVFREETSPLYDSSRRPTVNSGADRLDDAIVVTGTQATLASTVFADFGPVVTFGGRAINQPEHMGLPHGSLESVPHDLIHGWVGGNLGNLDMAGRDPAFYVHHANIDRLWEVWLQMGGGRANPANEAWLNQQFTFIDEDKRRATISVRDLVNTASLGYTYERITPPPVNLTRPASTTRMDTLVTVNMPGQTLGNQPVQLTLTLPQGGQAKVFNNLVGTRKYGTSMPGQIQLRLEGVKFSGHPDSAVGIFLNMPKNQKADPRNPYYAGCFTFFGHTGHHGERVSYADVTRQFQKVWPGTNRNSREITVTLVRLSPGVLPQEFQTQCTCGQLSLAVSQQ